MSEIADYAAVLDRLKNARVACVGDLMLDWFIDGEVERISPEAPIPVLRITEERSMLGGAGNVVRNIVALGATATFASVIGYDQAGREVTALLEKEIGRTPGLVVEQDRPSTIKTRYFAGAQQILRADKETQSPLGRAAQDDLLQRCVAIVGECDVLIMSDYAKGVLTPTVIEVLIARAHSNGKRVVVDPKGADYARYRGAYVICPNRRELHEATGLPATTDEEVVAAARHLRDNCRIENVLVTRSQDGLTLLAGDEVHHMPARAREVFDVSGAGDTVVAALATAL
ncbi:MAG: PfkB family carbohydrate kinase, partial [Acetobacterales bacterium]